MQIKLQEIKNKIEAALKHQYSLQFQRKQKQDRFDNLQKDYKHLEEAKQAIHQAAKVTQEQVKYAISEAGTLMLASIFDDPPKLGMEFGIKHNQPICNVFLEKDGEKYHAMGESGFGEANITGYGLRIAVWGLPSKRTRPVIIADEPFMNLKTAEANKKAIQAVKKISETLGLQVIMISDERADISDILDNADRVIKVTKKTGNMTQPKLEYLK